MPRVSCFLILAWTALAGDAVFAAENLPQAPPAAPSTQAQKIPNTPFRCDRLIKYRGKTLPCDSALRRDGESLRTIFENSPDALEELDRYQSGRNSLKYAAYTGSVGIFLALASGMVTNLFIPENRGDARQSTSHIVRLTGLGMTVGGVVFGLSRLRSNEDHLQSAIIKYNASQPDKPIEILFKTEF